MYDVCLLGHSADYELQLHSKMIFETNLDDIREVIDFDFDLLGRFVGRYSFYLVLGVRSHRSRDARVGWFYYVGFLECNSFHVGPCYLQ